jgi:hypothetical protein
MITAYMFVKPVEGILIALILLFNLDFASSVKVDEIVLEALINRGGFWY